MRSAADLLSGFTKAGFGAGESGIMPQARLSGPMPWVIAIMVALTVIALAAGLALNNLVDQASAELQGGATVQILEPRAEIRRSETLAAEDALRAMPGVRSAQAVPQEEVYALIEPWLGSAEGTTAGFAIPVPALIDVRLEGEASESAIATMRERLIAAAPSARVDAQADWLKPVFGAIASLQWLAIALVMLLALALAAAVLLAARTALGTNRDTIEIVHLLGGTDRQIAGVFQRSIGIDAVGGGIVGFTMALVVILFLSRRFAGLGAGMVDSGTLAWSDWLLLALVPAASTLLAMMTARLTVLHALRKML